MIAWSKDDDAMSVLPAHAFPVMKQKRIVLVVEDDEDLRRMYRTALMLEGFYVYEAANGYDALSVLEQDATDLVVLDLKLPRIDGLSVLKRFRQPRGISQSSS